MTAMFRARSLAAALAFCISGAASAATFTEADQSGGAFSADWSRPTAVGAGYDRIQGTGSQNVYDNFVFTALPTGAQKITIDFFAPKGIDQSYSAGGQALFSEKPFRWGWDGSHASSVQVDFYKQSQSVVIDLADSFKGTLYLALNFTHGANLGYGIATATTAPTLQRPAGPVFGGAPTAGESPAPVPLPAAVWLLGAGMAALGAAGWKRRRAAA